MPVTDASTSKKKPLRAARQGLGRTGERLATEHLTALGYRILERNFRCTCGEIDLIAEHEQDLVFVEVKTRRGTAYGLPEDAVTLRKKRKIIQVATCYLDERCCPERSWRIDVVAVQLSTGGKLEEIRVHPHAVMQE
ncbi:MAG: YraN family protein [Chloroflexi bacterium]|nr:YraN family protein [Ktedonobacteraceae bacterium]MBV9708512.1 YraN family protein [Chloroflexota bacterium]